MHITNKKANRNNGVAMFDCWEVGIGVNIDRLLYNLKE